MWVKRLQTFYSLNTMILEAFGANIQTGTTKSKTHIRIKSRTTNCVLLQLSSLLLHRKLLSLRKFLFPTFDMKHDLRFHLFPLNITRPLTDFMFFRTQYPWRNCKTNRRSSSDISPVALWEIYSSQTSLYRGWWDSGYGFSLWKECQFEFGQVIAEVTKRR